MDNFGTKRSLLMMLRTFPFDKIKHDRSFVFNVHETPEPAAIIQTTVLSGEAMSIPILAGGVEHRGEPAFLRRSRCNFVQGFIFGEPLQVGEARDLAAIPIEYRRLWF